MTRSPLLSLWSVNLTVWPKADGRISKSINGIAKIGLVRFIIFRFRRHFDPHLGVAVKLLSPSTERTRSASGASRPRVCGLAGRGREAPIRNDSPGGVSWIVFVRATNTSRHH